VCGVRTLYMKIESVSRLEVTKSFAKYLPLVIFAGLFYTLIISGGILFLANERVVSLISSCYMELGSTDLKIKASYPGGSKEQQYLYANIEKIVFGQNLSWTESSLEKMSKYGIIVNSGMSRKRHGRAKSCTPVLKALITHGDKAENRD